MKKNFYVDSYSNFADLKLGEYLQTIINPILNINRPIILLCIGSDRCIGDCLGPLVGYKLSNFPNNLFNCYGSLESPIHAKNFVYTSEKITSEFSNPFIITIDSSLGSINSIGKILVSSSKLCPGLALKKNLPTIGDVNITGIVNIASKNNFATLQNTKLNIVMNLADCITNSFFSVYYKLTNQKSIK